MQVGHCIKSSGFYPVDNQTRQIAEGQLININGTNVLNPDLVVHHKDGDKTNNNPNNLIILTEQEHANIHQGKKHKDNTVVKKCLNCGKEFEVKKSRNDSAKFCCIKCSNIYRRKDIIETKCPHMWKHFLP